MRVILSRKGFDSSNGGIVSPIFEDGTLVSFPIPSDDKDSFSDLQYEGVLYSDILLDLHYRGKDHCHVDPDLDQNRRKAKVDGWVPAFGQINQSAVYLKNNGIREGETSIRTKTCRSSGDTFKLERLLMIRLNKEDYGGILIHLKIEGRTRLMLSLGLQKNCLLMTPSLVRGCFLFVWTGC